MRAVTIRVAGVARVTGAASRNDAHDTPLEVRMVLVQSGVGDAHSLTSARLRRVAYHFGRRQTVDTQQGTCVVVVEAWPDVSLHLGDLRESTDLVTERGALWQVESNLSPPGASDGYAPLLQPVQDLIQVLPSMEAYVVGQHRFVNSRQRAGRRVCHFVGTCVLRCV